MLRNSTRTLTQKDWRIAGVVGTCRWLACATVRPASGGAWYSPSAPVTEQTGAAHEEVIAAECLEAEKLAMRHPAWLDKRPGWIDAVVDTLNWAWRGSGVPPIDMSQPG
ncbi:hypothetical protein [Actinokineospora alba]|uniref:hypothetical protein n=1 Tax=Actinokineospora alba TaxID=504798 RepID=UPI000B86384B|nr:hypothetical protein [Actinokineospora alba]